MSTPNETTTPAQETPTAAAAQTQTTTQDAKAADPAAAQAKAPDPGAAAVADPGGKGSEPQAKAPGDKSSSEPAKSETEDGAVKPAVVPEKYDLKLAEKSPLDPKHLEKIASFAKERGLSQDQAQALLDRDNQLAVEQQANWDNTQKQWVNEVQADKELGGERYAQNIENAKRALDQFASPNLRKQLNETGLGNHPELVRVFARIGKAMADDTIIVPGRQAGEQKSAAEVLYGSAKKEN